MALKLDMSKAYDRVEWPFLEEVMRKMGFNERWINLVMVCVKSVTYSILMNGEPCGMIQPTRWIMYGDPFSPFLFLLCTEGLNSLVKKVDMEGNIHSFSLCNPSALCRLGVSNQTCQPTHPPNPTDLA